MKGLNEMKKHLILFFALLLSIGAGAQDTRKFKSIGLRTGVNVTFEKNEVDSVIAILNDAGDTLGVKVYCVGAKGVILVVLHGGRTLLL